MVPEELERIEVFKLTRDDWYPAYTFNQWHEGNAPGKVKLVEVKFLELHNESGWRVCVWGNDDFGMERDYLFEERSIAYEMFLKVIAQKYVNVQFLKDDNFVNA